MKMSIHWVSRDEHWDHWDAALHQLGFAMWILGPIRVMFEMPVSEVDESA